jgi:hypothetical protein
VHDNEPGTELSGETERVFEGILAVFGKIGGKENRTDGFHDAPPWV